MVVDDIFCALVLTVRTVEKSADFLGCWYVTVSEHADVSLHMNAI